MTLRIIQEGLTAAGTSASPKDQWPSEEKQITRSARLFQLTSEYHFYIPAALYLKVPLFGREPFLDFLDEYKKHVVPARLVFESPLFAGLTPEWNHSLYALPTEEWEAYRRWIGPVGFWDRESGVVYRVRFQDLLIEDPLDTFSATPAAVPVTAFAIETSRGDWFYRKEALLGKGSRHRLVGQLGVDRGIAAFAAGLNSEHPRPYSLVDQENERNGSRIEEEIRQKLQSFRQDKEP